jgi:hypothetical protein
MTNKKKWYKELEEAREWISEFLRDFGIALIAGSIMASAIDYRYWYSLIFGLLFLYASSSFKFGKRVKMTKKEFERIDYMILILTFSVIAMGGILFFFQRESLPYFVIFLGVWIGVGRKSIHSAIMRIIKRIIKLK